MALVVCGSGSASAATLKANYQLRGDRASTIAGAPRLSSVGTPSRFAHETVDGSTRRMLAFPRGGGLSLATARLVSARSHSVAMLFRLSDVLGYRRIVDFTNGASDNGVYNLNGRAVLYLDGAIAVSKSVVFGDSYVQLVVTNAPTAGGRQQTTLYVNGVRVARARTSGAFQLQSGVLRLFKDNATGPGSAEESAGSLACVLVYDGALNARQVRHVARKSPHCPASRSSREALRALVTARPSTRSSNGSITVDTGLTVSCRVGAAPCTGMASARRGDVPGIALGTVRFSVPPGASRSIGVRLSARGARALRKAGQLKIQVSAKIAASGGRKATARQVARVRVPRPEPPPPPSPPPTPTPPQPVPVPVPQSPGFVPGDYSGSTGQDLPITLTVSPGAVDVVRFYWRATCADGMTYTNSIVLQHAPIVQGRFSFDRILTTGARAQVSGEIVGTHASGTFSRSGGSSFGTDCVATDVWSAQLP